MKQTQGIAAPVLAIVLGMVSIQVGAAIAQGLFVKVGPAGAVALRTGLAALILFAVNRPSPRLDRAALLAVAPYGAALGLMNLLFFAALQRIPQGVAVAAEFTGPLILAGASGRSWRDLIWLVLAAAGVALLAPIGQGGAADPVGLLFALAAGGCWAAYIQFGQRASRLGAGAATTWGMALAALLAMPFGVAQAGTRLVDLAVLPAALAVAVLSSALPYSLEMYGLARLPKVTFSTLMSLEPAIAAAAGALFLRQNLTARQALAIGCVMVASLGAGLTFAHRQTRGDLPPTFGLD
ncbi:MAG TPA: EamA family transporter [Caulobacteraceae bacterium]|nr:EamA family transporter [Caulobacteraceae bacterium]